MTETQQKLNRNDRTCRNKIFQKFLGGSLKSGDKSLMPIQLVSQFSTGHVLANDLFPPPAPALAGLNEWPRELHFVLCFLFCVCDRERSSPEAQKRRAAKGKALIEDNYVMCHVFAISGICETRSNCDVRWGETRHCSDTR